MAYKTPILIFCRIKPHLSESYRPNDIQEYTVNEGHGIDKDVLSISNYQTINILNHKPDSYNFQFVKVFDQVAEQDEIYDTVAKPVVQSALKGYNGTIFAYGQTGSGKTHTISGDSKNPGIVPRALQDIFTSIERAKGERYEVQMSYLEIYNEQSNDLLMPTIEEKKKISLREGGDKILEWHNLSLAPVHSYGKALELLRIGDNNRIVGDTPMNVYSSRSHTILSIHLTAHLNDNLEIRRAKLNLVDLAGSERVHKTGEEGIVLEEARHINLSLHYLEQVIVALSDPARSHVPYRNCMLTAALRDSLGGNCMTVMVANIAVDKANIEESISTCRFAQRVSLVRNEVTVNTERDLTGENAQLKAEIQQLKGQCSSLRAKVQELEERGSSDMNIHRLKTDIIYMIDWLQEVKSKQSGSPDSDDSNLTTFNVLSKVDSDEVFENFLKTLEASEDWTKAREAAKTTANALATKLDTINSVHQEILDWWKQNENSLVREMLSGRVINLPGSENCGPTLNATQTPSLALTAQNQTSLDNLLHTHSDLLKDFQLLKSRLKSSRRNLQRIKRRFLVEFNTWKKVKQTEENILEKIEYGDLMEFENIQNNDIETEPEKKLFNDKKIFTSHSQLENSVDMKCFWNNQDFTSDNSVLFNESDLSSLNCSVFSTSTLFSARVTDICEPRGCKEPRLVRSVPTTLHVPNSRSYNMGTTPLRLTGDQDVDEEIIAFYQRKCLN